ncbi:hypothetical protein RvY_00492 [Ramazzottius varieornatus]|uniref:Uncharacterized protein n=1 Tax=Ramazzottius varieornatus TaxID=947166 RepID=A0A1D1UND2_RAMVA|nr:hypothetical protein RvY_00492 [Ramazzottius varieornatus]
MQYVEAILRPFFHRDGGNIEVIKATCLALGTPFFTKLIFPVDGGALGSEFHSRKILDSLRITLRTEKGRSPVTRLLPSPIQLACYLCPSTAGKISWKDYNVHVVSQHDVEVTSNSPRCERCLLLLKDLSVEQRLRHACYCPKRQAPLLASPTFSWGRKAPEPVGVRLPAPNFPVVFGEVDVEVLTLNENYVEVSFRSF